MKLRIKGDTIRLRLTQSEVQQFGSDGHLKEKTHFGHSVLSYSLEQKPSGKLDAQFNGNQLRVYIPSDVALNWVNSNEISLRNEIELKANRKLSILVEKDFKCLDERLDEDQSDNFPNPNAIK